MMGSHLGIAASGLVQLGAAALLHDIGTVRVPDGIFFKPSALTADELRELRQRTLFTQQILSQLEKQYAYLSEIAIQVYERIDGSGYPSGLKGGDIHEYAKIIGLVDVYEALIHSRPHRDRFLHFPAIKEILRSGKHAFDKRLLKALISVVSLFPVSGCVRLNSGAIGRVLEADPKYPLRPKVKIMYDSQERPVPTERIVNLRENVLLFIVDTVAEDVVSVDSAR
jgi:HD-GYP domain-containing protein (c-di-GMP phosphodiesterase class II)